MCPSVPNPPFAYLEFRLVPTYARPNGGYGHDLVSLGHTQVIAQVSASAGLDTQAVGIMAFDVALAGIFIGLKGAAYLWVAAALMFAYSVGWAVQPLLIEGAEVGQSLAESLEERANFGDGELRHALFTSIVTASEENRLVLAQKTTYIGRALRWTALALVVAVVGVMFSPVRTLPIRWSRCAQRVQVPPRRRRSPSG